MSSGVKFIHINLVVIFVLDSGVGTLIASVSSIGQTIIWKFRTGLSVSRKVVSILTGRTSVEGGINFTVQYLIGGFYSNAFVLGDVIPTITQQTRGCRRVPKALINFGGHRLTFVTAVDEVVSVTSKTSVGVRQSCAIY